MKARAVLWFFAVSFTLQAYALPTFEATRAMHVSSDAVLLDREGEAIHEMRVDRGGRRLDWTALPDVSPALVEAVMRSEDRRFYDHAGVDWLALMRAAAGNAFAKTPRGASTITMQLAALVDDTVKARGRKRTLQEKWRQVEAALELERHWSKRHILEAYLNLVTFRGELQGIAAASRGLFGKAPSGIDRHEAALLAALLRGPGAGAERVARRACHLGGDSDCEGITARARQSLGRPYMLTADRALAPFVARKLLVSGVARATSTLDAGLQRFALEALQRQLATLEGMNVADGAVLVVENEGGEVLAYVGNAGTQSSARFVDGVMALRQAGSTLKPFLYELALERRLLTAASLIDDSPVNLVTPTGLYVPQNYDREFRGLVSARSALSGSLNVPAVRTLMLTGTDNFVARLRALGFGEVTGEGDYYGYALALGSPEVRLWQLVNAYRTLANGGVASPLVLAPAAGTPQRVRVMDAAAAHIIADILADRGARSISFGLANPLSTRFWSAVKTGTSKDMRDNWCVGFTERYTVGVWVGNFSGASMWDVSGVSGAAPLWLELITYLYRDGAGRPPSRPSGVASRHVAFEPPVEPAREELFLKGTEQARVELTPAQAARPRISYPGNGEVIALDPDIPHGRQRVRFAMNPRHPAYAWRLDETPLEPDRTWWQPVAGRHVLALIDAGGAEVDRVEFEVRGGPGRAPALD